MNLQSIYGWFKLKYIADVKFRTFCTHCSRVLQDALQLCTLGHSAGVYSRTICSCVLQNTVQLCTLGHSAVVYSWTLCSCVLQDTCAVVFSRTLCSFVLQDTHEVVYSKKFCSCVLQDILQLCTLGNSAVEYSRTLCRCVLYRTLCSCVLYKGHSAVEYSRRLLLKYKLTFYSVRMFIETLYTSHLPHPRLFQARSHPSSRINPLAVKYWTPLC